MDESQREMIEDLFSHISFALTEQGRISPLYIMILPDGSQMPIIAQGGDLTVEMYASAAHSAAHEMGAKGMIFICEQYMVSKTKDDKELQALLDGQIRPSQHPDAEEYLTLMYMTAIGECESLIAKIHKDPMGTKYTNEREWIENSTTALLTPWKEGN